MGRPVLRGAVVLGCLPVVAVLDGASCTADHPDATRLLALARAAVHEGHAGTSGNGILYTSHDVSFTETEVCATGDFARMTATVDERLGMVAVDGNTGVPEATYTSGPATFTFWRDDRGWHLVRASLSV